MVNLLREGNEQAFAYLYDNYSKALAGIIHTYTESTEETEDILQSCFIKIWNNFSQYDASKSRLYTWMINIVRNACIDYTRSKSYKNKSKNRSLENIVYDTSSKQVHYDNHDHIGLDTLMNKLKEEHQLVIRMAYFDGFTHEEVSKQLNMPLGTVKTKIRQAILSLREMMK